MLFPYKYVPHTMDKMQEFIDFIFNDVWCKAPGGGAFDMNLFAGKPELRELMEAFFTRTPKGPISSTVTSNASMVCLRR